MIGLRRFLGDSRGAMAIETALVAPVLAVMALGTFDVSRMVSKQQDLQSAASEASEIILAAAGGSGVNSNDLHDILVASLGLADDQLTITQLFRCNDAAETVSDASGCDASQPIYQYVQLTITDSYTPQWTNFGVGHTIDYSVVRTVQVA